MMNMTELAQMPQNEAIMTVHQTWVVPNLLILYSTFALIFLLVGLIMINNKKSGYSKFLTIYFISMSIITVGVLLPLLFLPNLTQDLVQSIISLFKV